MFIRQAVSPVHGDALADFLSDGRVGAAMPPAPGALRSVISLHS